MLNVANIYFIKKICCIFYFDISLFKWPEMKCRKEAKQAKACYLDSQI